MSDTISRQAAIDALIEWYGCEPSDVGAFEDILEKMPSAQETHEERTETHACDLISRQAAIEYLMTNMNWYDEDGYESDDDYKRECITELINGVPSAQPTIKFVVVDKLGGEDRGGFGSTGTN